MSIRITHQTLLALSALHGAEQLSGAEITRATGLKSGTLYPILSRLEAAGWVASDWEEGDPVTLGRPRRRFYRITAVGARSARQQASSLQPHIDRLAMA